MDFNVSADPPHVVEFRKEVAAWMAGHGERLVELEEPDVLDREPGLRQRLLQPAEIWTYTNLAGMGTNVRLLFYRPRGQVEYRPSLIRRAIPTVTTIGVTFGSLLSGAVLTETIFSWPGLGRYATHSVTSLDFPAVMGVTLLAALVYTLTNLVVDLGYQWLDPRIRHD